MILNLFNQLVYFLVSVADFCHQWWLLLLLFVFLQWNFTLCTNQKKNFDIMPLYIHAYSHHTYVHLHWSTHLNQHQCHHMRTHTHIHTHIGLKLDEWIFIEIWKNCMKWKFKWKGREREKILSDFSKKNKMNPSSCSEWMEYWRWSFKNIKTYSTCMQLLIYGSVSGFEVGNHCKE